MRCTLFCARLGCGIRRSQASVRSARNRFGRDRAKAVSRIAQSCLGASWVRDPCLPPTTLRSQRPGVWLAAPQTISLSAALRASPCDPLPAGRDNRSTAQNKISQMGRQICVLFRRRNGAPEIFRLRVVYVPKRPKCKEYDANERGQNTAKTKRARSSSLLRSPGPRWPGADSW